MTAVERISAFDATTVHMRMHTFTRIQIYTYMVVCVYVCMYAHVNLFIHHMCFACRSGMHFHFFAAPRDNVAIVAAVTQLFALHKKANNAETECSDKRQRARIAYNMNKYVQA